MAENKQTNDCASFKNVQKSYPPGEHLTIQYELLSDYVSASRDWVGLFQVGWTSSRDYYTFEWAPSPENNKGTVTFAGRRLPPEDSHFYQFCYVSSNGRVRGASPPFQFSSASLCKHNVEDLELVEVSEDSLMVLQEKSSQEAEVQKKLTSAKESVSTLEVANQELNEQITLIQAEKQQQSGALREMETVIEDLQRQLQAKRESEQRLMEKLDAQRAENHKLMAVKDDEETKLALFASQMATKESEISQQVTVILTLTTEVNELKSTIQIKESQVEDLTQLASARGEEKEQISAELDRITEELLDFKGKHADVLEQLEHKTIETEQLNLDLEDTRAAVEQAAKKIEDLQQELDIARQNISELMGQEQGDEVVFERPVALPEPPTAPAPADGMVDPSVYGSLLEAFENLQKYYEDIKKDNQDLQLRNDELLARVEQCRLQYEDLAKENAELLKRRGAGDRIRELEEQVQSLTESCEISVAELSSRKEELKRKDVQISELEDALQQVTQELTGLQDRHDTEIQRRVEANDIQKAALDAKIQELAGTKTEIARLAHVNDQLKAQLEGLKSSARASNRTCPVCSTKFPARMNQQDFENHVQGHFRS